MKKLFLTAIALCAIVSLSAQEKNFIDVNYIEVNGRAEMEVAPDEIYLSITINEKDNKGKVSIDQQEKDMFNRLKNIGIDLEKDLTVQDMSTDLQTYLLKKNAIRTQKSYQLKVNSTAMLAKVFQALGDAGISEVNVEKTAISNIQELRKELRVVAAKAAQENASQLAEAVGRKVGKALYIQDYSYVQPYFRNVAVKSMANVTLDMAAGAVEQAPALDFEKTMLELSVTARFSMED